MRILLIFDRFPYISNKLFNNKNKKLIILNLNLINKYKINYFQKYILIKINYSIIINLFFLLNNKFLLMKK